jgi:futalosine hydrolase
MSFKILYITATTAEADTLKKIVELKSMDRSKFEIISLITGIGSVATAWAMKSWFGANGKPDLAINAGIAGSYNEELVPGDVVMPYTDCFADVGIDDNGSFNTLFEAGLSDENEFPFKDGQLNSDPVYFNKLKNIIKPVRAITLNTATGSELSRAKWMKKYNPDIETMEGATFFYICTLEEIPFLAIRAISNRVEPRDKSKWEIALALNNLSEKLSEILLTLV